MEIVYTETIHTFAQDLDTLWNDKNEDGETNQNCTLQNFMQSASKGSAVNIKTRILPLGLTQKIELSDRLAKSASIWTRPELNRLEAESILADYETGIFLVRMNSDGGTMVLTYKVPDKVQHVMIKVDMKKGFYMDGSANIFRNVNIMIAHYMKYAIQAPDVFLKLPTAIMEAKDTNHFKLFENMKIDFWRSAIARKHIVEIWPKSKPTSQQPVHSSGSQQLAIPYRSISSPISHNSGQSSQKTVLRTACSEENLSPPVPPRGYEEMEINFIQGLADNESSCETEVQEESTLDSNVYNSIVKERPPQIYKNNESSVPNERIYSAIWKYETKDENKEEKKVGPPPIPPYYSDKTNKNKSDKPYLPKLSLNSSQSNRVHVNQKKETIPGIIQFYYPQLFDPNFQVSDFSFRPSLTDEILQKRNTTPNVDIAEKTDGFPVVPPVIEQNPVIEPTSGYETPWDLQNSWISKLIDPDTQNQQQVPYSRAGSLPSNFQQIPSNKPRGSSDSSFDTDEDEIYQAIGFGSPLLYAANNKQEPKDASGVELNEHEIRLKEVLLTEIQPVIITEDYQYDLTMKHVSQYGRNIRCFLDNLCSRNGSSEISSSIKMFVKCTIERTDLSPYTTMRLIKQFMSGLKNYINQQKKALSLTAAIEEERKNTPKSVFINFDSMLESVLTREILKPLTEHCYKLLVLEHYKNNNLKLISDGIKHAASVSPDKLGLKDEHVNLLKSKIPSIRFLFEQMSNTYSPERKLGYFISIVEKVINVFNSASNSTKQQCQFKIDNYPDTIVLNLLPAFVFLFSQCKESSLASQCEVEFIEGLIWSDRLINGKPGFFLLILMSALESIKVLGRPTQNSAWDKTPTNCTPATVIDNSLFFSKINPTSLASTSVGSINVIILDEKVNRPIMKTFPVRSTINSKNLCNTIAHRLGIYNPDEYALYKFTGFEEILITDLEFPLIIKHEYQTKTGESIHFLFKRKNANFILPHNLV